MTSVHDVINEYISIIENEVDDPNVLRKTDGLKWVYDDIPFAVMGNKYPRISVLSFGNPNEMHEVGSNRQRLNVRIEIQIRVRRNKFNNKTPQEFLDDLGLEVMEALRKSESKTSLLSNCNVFQTVLEAENIIYEDDVLIKQMIYKNILVR
jgi:hypothetical protein